MREVFPDVSTERMIRRQVAAVAVHAFYILYTPGIHADPRREMFVIDGLAPQPIPKSHRYSCKE